MAQYYTLPTAIGEAKIANAIALGNTISISELAIGDGGGATPTPDSDRIALVNQVRRAAINTSSVDPDNPNWIVVEQVLPPDIGGWTIREIGLFDADGDMIAYGNYPETYKPQLSEGSGRTQTIRFVMQVSDTAAVTLKVDPAVVLATRQYADDGDTEVSETASAALTAHAESRNHPAATTTAQGMIEKATVAEAKAGATDKFPDAAGVKVALDNRIADQATVDAGEDNTKFVTSLTLGKRLKNDAVWAAKAPGELFALRDDQPGVEPPPTDNPAYRYIKLTAGESGPGGYNEGILINETVDGSSPHITATAEINAPGHDRHGEIVELINTDRRVIRAGESGTLQDDALQQMTGTLGRYFQTSTSSGGNAGSGVLRYNHVAWGGSTGGASQGTITFNASYGARTSNETRVRTIGGTYYERVF